MLIVQTSRAARRLVGRLEQGETVHEALVALANTHEVMAGQVTATGILEDVALALFDAERRAYGPLRTFRGAMQVLSLQGSLSWLGNALVPQLQVALARETDNGIQVLGGQLVAARVVALELVIECWDDLSLERFADARTGLALWTGAASAPSATNASSERSVARGPAAPAAPPASSFAPAIDPPASTPAPVASHAPYVAPGVPAPTAARDPAPTAPAAAAAVASGATSAGAAVANAPRSLTDVARALDAMPARQAADDKELDRPEPQPGDVLDHPSFGLVEVESEDEQGRLRIRLPSGTRREILLEVFDITQREPRNGKRVWALRPRRR